MNTFLASTFFTFVVAFLTFHGDVSGQQAQYFRLFNSAACAAGTSFGNATASGNFTKPGPNSTIISYQVNGLWAIEFCNASTITCHDRSIRTGENSNCNSITIGSPGDTRVQLTRFGDANQVEQRIHFFDQNSLQGNQISVSASGNDFNPAMTARSYFFTGANQWQYKASPAAVTGGCLNYTAVVGNRGYGISYQATSTLQIGYVRHGCNTTTTTTTTRPTTTTPRLTTNSTSPTNSTTTTTRVPTTTRRGSSSMLQYNFAVIILSFFLASRL